MKRIHVALIVGSLATIPLLVGPGEAIGDPAGYVFSNVSLLSIGTEPDSDARVANVSFEYSWKTGEYPGLYNCLWTASTQDQVVGRASNDFLSLGEAGTGRAEIPLEESTPNGLEPTQFEVECEQVSPADTSGRYQFAGIQTGPWLSPGTMVEDAGSVTVHFNAQWVGTGPANPRACVIDVLSPSGDLLASDDVNVLAMTPVVDAQIQIKLPDGVERTGGETAAIHCGDG